MLLNSLQFQGVGSETIFDPPGGSSGPAFLEILQDVQHNLEGIPKGQGLQEILQNVQHNLEGILKGQGLQEGAPPPEGSKTHRPSLESIISEIITDDAPNEGQIGEAHSPDWVATGTVWTARPEANRTVLPELPEEVVVEVRRTSEQVPVNQDENVARTNEPKAAVPEPSSGPVAENNTAREVTTGPSAIRSEQPLVQRSGNTQLNTPVDTVEDSHRVADQVIRSARFISRDGVNQVTVALDPPELGEVTIRLESKGSTLSGEISVESRQVLEIVQPRLADLRQALAEQGIQVERLDVSVDHRGAPGQNRDESDSLSRDRTDSSDRDDSSDQEGQYSRWTNRQERNSGAGEGHFDFTA